MIFFFFNVIKDLFLFADKLSIVEIMILGTDNVKSADEKELSERKTAGFSQTQLANKLGKTQSYVSKCEIGERRLDLIEFLEILSVLKVSSKSIISEIEETLKKEKGFK